MSPVQSSPQTQPKFRCESRLRNSPGPHNTSSCRGRCRCLSNKCSSHATRRRRWHYLRLSPISLSMTLRSGTYTRRWTAGENTEMHAGTAGPRESVAHSTRFPVARHISRSPLQQPSLQAPLFGSWTTSWHLVLVPLLVVLVMPAVWCGRKRGSQQQFPQQQQQQRQPLFIRSNATHVVAYIVHNAAVC
jgi:hypothetical protein